MISDLITWFIWLFIIIMVHELGHLFMAWRLGYKAKLKWFSCDVYGRITPKHDYLISMGGLLAGFLPLFLASNIFTTYAALALLVVYLVGTREDLVVVLRGFKNVA